PMLLCEINRVTLACSPPRRRRQAGAKERIERTALNPPCKTALALTNGRQRDVQESGCFVTGFPREFHRVCDLCATALAPDNRYSATCQHRVYANDDVRNQRRQAIWVETIGMVTDACRCRTLRAHDPSFLITGFRARCRPPW